MIEARHRNLVVYTVLFCSMQCALVANMFVVRVVLDLCNYAMLASSCSCCFAFPSVIVIIVVDIGVVVCIVVVVVVGVVVVLVRFVCILVLVRM